jgi:hypothetical protein
MIAAELYARLTGDATVSALVATRIYPGRAPQDVPAPFIRWQTISRVGSRSIDGVPSALVTARVQIDSYALSYVAAQAIGDAVRRALQFWGSDATTVLDAEQLGELYLFESDIVPPLHRIEQDWSIVFTDT